MTCRLLFVCQILQVERGASDGEIKSSYRKLSLLYHPDKNPGNEEAAKMFMDVAKAYETLTDPTAKENWEQYGNPDGKQSFAVSVWWLSGCLVALLLW